jgi:hypothetical protein
MATTDPPNIVICPKTQRKHEWRLADVRTLQGVRPPVTVKDWECQDCRLRKQTDDPII